MMHAAILGWWFHQERAGAGIAASGLPAWIFWSLPGVKAEFLAGRESLYSRLYSRCICVVQRCDTKIPVWLFCLRSL